MAVNGTYDIEIETPMGTQKAKLTLKADGDKLGGVMESPMGTQEFSDGTINVDEVAWEMEINSPMGNMNLEYKLKVTGDNIAGEVKAGNFGSSPLKGKRV